MHLSGEELSRFTSNLYPKFGDIQGGSMGICNIRNGPHVRPISDVGINRVNGIQWVCYYYEALKILGNTSMS